MFNRDFIKENIPPYEATSIGVYDDKGNEVGQVPLFYFKKERGERLYSFGALSDVHNKNDQSAESTADLQRALRLFNDREDVVFTCISGDLTEVATEEEFQIYQNNVNTCSPDTPVYATPGNHDCYGSSLNLALWKQYTGCERTYEIKYGNDHFLFLGMNKWSMGSSSCTPYLQEDLTWLSEKLEAYKNERCFIFTHLFFPKHAGNLKDIYPSANWLMGTQHDFLKDLLNRYTNTIWFSGHSHWKWHLQKYQKNANIQRAGGWTVHIPSCATPIDSDGISTRVGKPLESEGAIIDVYENYIDIRGIDLKNDIYIPIAQYRLDTKLIEVGKKDNEVTLNLNNVTVSNNSNKIKGGETYINTITPTAEGMLIITVAMDGVDITSTAVNGNTISISEVTGDIVITATVVVGFSTDLLTTYDVQLNKRWSSSSNTYLDSNGRIAFSVPFSDIDGRTVKIIGFPKENSGISTWYAYKDGRSIGRIADGSVGTVWTSSSLVDNGNGSYDLPISKKIFMEPNTQTPLSDNPDTIYITMYVKGGTEISSVEGLKMLLSDLN